MKLLILFLCCTISTVAGDADASFRGFIYDAMQNFDEWIADEGLDPTPPLDRQFDMDLSSGLFRINGTLNDVTIHGLSKPMYSFSILSTSFMDNRIDFSVIIESAGLSGTYDASGSILDTYPISGQDTWNVTSNPFNLRFSSSGFQLENGFIVLQNQSFAYFSFVTPNTDTVFNNLFTPETIQFEEDVTKEIARRLYENVFGSRATLFEVHIKNYLQSLFSVTPASEIITWPIWDPTPTTSQSTMPPLTSTQITAFPTTTPPTTSYPTTPTTTYPTMMTTYETTTTHPPSTTTPMPTTIECRNGNTGDARSEGLNSFLIYAFRNFGDWLIEHGLDPTLPVTQPADITIDSSFLRLNGTFRYTTALGMSRNRYSIYPESDFVAPQFSFGMQMSNLTIYGLYDAEGIIISTYPINGAGMWTLSNFNLGMDFHISGFAITNGFIDITQYETRTISMYPDTNSATLMSIPDLISPEDADGLGKEVLDVLMEIIPSQLNAQDKHPVSHAILDYLNAIFSETPLSEIIATTRPPGCV